jgi:hypothetical protein
MKNAILLLLACISLTAFAEPSRLPGVYGHDFTTKKADAVWTVKQRGDAFEVKRHGDGSVASGKSLSAEQRKEFWEKMWWESDAYMKAECLGAEDDVFCFVPAPERAKESWLKDYTSNYFHYDPAGGLIEMRRIGN